MAHVIHSGQKSWENDYNNDDNNSKSSRTGKPSRRKEKECTIGEMGFYTLFLFLFYFPVVFERIDSFMMKTKWSTNPKKNFLAIPAHLLCPLPRGMYVFFSLHLSALSFWLSPKSLSHQTESSFRGGAVPSSLSRGQQAFWTLRDQFTLSPVPLNMYSHFP